MKFDPSYFFVALVLIGAGITALLYYAQHKDDGFDVRTLVVDSKSGRVSLFKVGQLTALVVSSWLVVHEALHARMSEWMFMGYMIAWTGSNIANKFVEKKQDA